jgi:two-component system phosphate regulon response regulator OmpR
VAERILMIDDDARLASMVSEYLGGAGYKVTTAANGAEGLERLEVEPYHALVLDLTLPDVDGLEVCRRVRAQWDLPVLMLTARGDALDRVIGLEIGADDYLPSRSSPASCSRA